MDFPPENIKDRVERLFTKEYFHDSIAIKIIIAVVIVLLGVFMFPHPELMEYNYSVGSVWVEKDLIAPIAFPIYKELREYERERQEASREVIPVFVRSEGNERLSIDSVKLILGTVSRAVDASKRWNRNRAPADSLAYANSVASLSSTLSMSDWKLLTESQENAKKGADVLIQRFEKILPPLMTEVLNGGILDHAKMKQTHSNFALRKGVTEETISYDTVYDLEEALNLIGTRLITVLKKDIERDIALKLIRAALQPNLLFDQNATNQSLQIALDNVARTIGFIQQNERIVSKHDRITEQVKLTLDSFRRAKAERGTNSNNWKHWLGVTLHILIILSLFALYLFLFRKKIFNDNPRLLLIAILLLMEMFFAYLTLTMNFQEPLQYLIFVPAASMLLAIIFDTKVAFYGTVTIAFLVAGIRGNDYMIGLSSIVAGALAAYTVRDIRSRTQIFWSMIYIFAGYTISIVALSFEQLENFSKIMSEVLFGLANAIISPVLTYGLLIFFERVFKVTTDLTFLEISDLNHPLMKELSEKAPGTCHHSIIIGNLAEAAAEAIGANSILARVGGYYHDIGKTLKPEYFVENQVGPHSRHNRLKPRMSALIISSHVREGVELGRERGLPEVVLDFIPQHHGTTRISFFFDKALKQAAKKPQKDEIHEEDFIYPGPKPQTKETGIVMLADSVEAITRSLIDLTPQKLEAAIDNVIKHRFMEGQLDECELTLRELTKIREGFLKMLLGIHHPRVKYPDQDIVETPVATKHTDVSQKQTGAPDITYQEVKDDALVTPMSNENPPVETNVNPPGTNTQFPDDSKPENQNL